MQWAMLSLVLPPLLPSLGDIIMAQIMARLIVAALFWSKAQGQALSKTSKSLSKTLLSELPSCHSYIDNQS
jgi:hypothetical protein